MKDSELIGIAKYGTEIRKGDVVRIKPWAEVQASEDSLKAQGKRTPGIGDHMSHCADTTFTVNYITDRGSLRADTSANNFAWHKDWVELVERGESHE